MTSGFGGRISNPMKASQLLAIGAVTFSVYFVATSTPAPSPAMAHEKIQSSDQERAPFLCLVGTEKCSAENDPPKICRLDAKSDESCPSDGFKVIDADLR
jgi:hypothetical protein